jgi:hypothetical protein
MSTHLRHDLRSLALHQEAVRVLRAHPEKSARKGDVHTMPLWEEWRRIIEGQLWELAVQDNDIGQQLRQASPLGFILSEDKRAEIFERFRRHPG